MYIKKIFHPVDLFFELKDTNEQISKEPKHNWDLYVGKSQDNEKRF